MGVFAGLFSLAGLSLFLAHALRRSSALMPLAAVALCMVTFSLLGMAGALAPGAFLWYGLCLLAFGYTVFKTKKGFFRLFTPGFVFFLAGAALFLVYCLAARPMLSHWDEFTFWGTAAKVTSRANELYTTARSSLIARSYQPGLIVFSYAMQFFGGYSEGGFIACFMTLYLACLAAGSALWQRHKPAALLFLAGMFCLPLFFSLRAPAGQMQWTYMVCMADLPMALFFGGGLCLYFAGEKKDTRLLAMVWLVMAGLCFMKDMGFAFAVLLLAAVALDLAVCRRQVSLFGLRGWKGLLAFAAGGAVLSVGAYALWTGYFGAVSGLNRLNFGTQGASLSPVDLLVTGVQMLLGAGRSQQFSAVFNGMLGAFFTRPVSLVGPGAVTVGVILLVCALAFALSPTRRARLRVLVFTGGMALLFLSFYVFNLFTYALVFKHQEALGLKDYARYISPFYIAWLMAALTLLARAAAEPRATFRRLRLARAGAGAAALCLVLAVGLLGNWQGNFLRVSPSHYGMRHSVKAVTAEAVAQGMKEEDEVYIISQGDDGVRFYLFGYELPAVRSLLYNGPLVDISGAPVTDEAGRPILHGNAASTLAPYGGQNPPAYATPANTADLTAFLKKEACTHVLVDAVDAYILEEFAPMFSDGLAGWSGSDPAGVGHRYYRIVWDGPACRLVPAQSAAGEGGGAGA